MRDLILLAVVLGILPFILRSPILGVLAWIWIALMNPQREVFGFLAGAQLNFVIAAVTLFAWAVSKERKTAPPNLTVILLALFVGWMCVTTFFALEQVRSGELLDRNLKTAVLLAAIAGIANTKSRIQAVIWAFAVSLAYFGVKGGAFVLASGGSYHVYGPPDSQIADNNNLGLALVLLLPLLNHLRSTSKARAVRLSVLGVMGLTIMGIMGTYSRGALLALAAMVAVSAVRSRTGIVGLVAAGLLVAAAPHVMPAQWFERMSSIQGAVQDVNEDESFARRVAAWRTSFYIATQRPTGGGFASIEHDWVAQAFPTPGGLTSGLAAHSVYFQVLGDHGFIGLALFLSVIASALFNTAMVIRATRSRPDMRWANQLARMLQVGIIAYMVGGAALSMAYYDGFLIVIILTAALYQTVKQGSSVAEEAATVPKWKTVQVENPSLPPPSPRPELT